MNKKKNAASILAVCCILCLFSCVGKTSYIPDFGRFTSARFEYSGDAGYKFITSEIGKLTTLGGLIEMCDESKLMPEGEPIYRIYYGWSPVSDSEKCLEVAFYNGCVTVGDITYKHKNEPDAPLEWAENKYEYFDYELMPEMYYDKTTEEK